MSTTGRKLLRHVRNGAAISTVVAVLTWGAVHWVTMLRVSSEWLGDMQVLLAQPPTAQHPDIVVLAITEDTLALFPFRAPINRRFLAELLATLSTKGIRAVGIDILFDQATNEEDDSALRELMSRYERPLVVAVGNETSNLTARQREFQSMYLEGIATGIANLVKHDGTVRYTSVNQSVGGRARPGFAAAIADALGRSYPQRAERLAFRDTGTSQPFIRVYPAERAALLPAPWLEDKIVLIGGILPNQDQHRTASTALGGKKATTPGVLIHAQMLAQFLDGYRITELSEGARWIMLFLLAALGFVVIVAAGPTWLKATFASLSLIALWGGAWFLQRGGGPMLALFPMSLAFLLSLTMSWAYTSREERAAKRFLRHAFTHYMSPNVIEDLVRNPEHLHLSGERREMSFVFADMEAYTQLSESIDPETLVGLVQDYQDGLVEIALKHGATIERFVGDATLIFFGAPLPQEDHAPRAVRCAVEWDAFCQAFRQKHRNGGIRIGVTRIGVHTGTAVVGNIGGRRRFAYTAHGDTVNVASRLESANKQFGTRVCMSREVAECCPDIRTRPIGRVVLKGKSEPLDLVTPCIDMDQQAYEHYMEAFAAIEIDRAVARDTMERLLRSYPEDGLIEYQVKRLRSAANDDVIVLEEK